jgi:hypothetical protein
VYRHDILLKSGVVVDSLNNMDGVMDVAIGDGKITEVAQEIEPASAREVFDMRGLWVIPGIIDTHAHAEGEHAHKMLALAGVTTVLDMAGPIDRLLDSAREYGAGLNIACLNAILPGRTAKGDDPSGQELRELLQQSLGKGAIGLKILGGHFPLTPEASRRAIEIANEHKAYIAFHAGSTRYGSNLEGFMEAVELAGNYSLHITHVNSYCRGMVRPYMNETEEVIAVLREKPNLRSESYLSPINAVPARCVNGVPASEIAKKCLVNCGLPATEEGMRQAIMVGSAQLNMEKGGDVILISGGEDAVSYWQDKGTDTVVSFNANPPEPRLRLAVAKRPEGRFVVDAISTDGGVIPRNVIVTEGLSLVKLKALTMKEFVLKTSYTPARMLGLQNKGHFSVNADADITVVDRERQKPVMTIIGGRINMYKGYVCGRSSRIVTTEAGLNYVQQKGLAATCIDIEQSAFYWGL